ncbi:hypothetical protein FRC17_002833, partial [Serendipita sp. 399]
MSQGYIATTGVTPVDPNNPVTRQEIRTFAKDRELMELYLQGLERFQAVDQQERLSYFQIAGIHGRPYIPYDGAGQRSLNQNFGGYCTHSSILFPPWHRPYLALFEQALATHVTAIANEYQGDVKAKYVAAAAKFRLPYWDWAANRDLPDFISIQKEVTVHSPTGLRTFPNPLYSYTFHPMYNNMDGLEEATYWEKWPSTLRYPTSRGPSGRSNTSLLEGTLQNNGLTLRDRTYILLTQYDSYSVVSNDKWPVPRGRFDSIESVHGSVHIFVGNDGHMGVADYAAFDPVFWLHHCNVRMKSSDSSVEPLLTVPSKVDRIFALWQALHPDSYVVKQVNGRGNFSTPAGTEEGSSPPNVSHMRRIDLMTDINTPLQPFRKPDGQFWTSAEVRDTRTFNYTYPELERWSQLGRQEKISRLATDINGMYGRSAPIASIIPELFEAATAKASVPNISRAKLAAEAAAQQPAPGQQVLKAPAAATSTVQIAAKAVPTVVALPPEPPVKKTGDDIDFSAADDPVLQDGKHYIEWVANITVEKYAAKTPLSVHIFLGNFSMYALQWSQDPNLVGTHVIFANNL